jgi:hypothetical protein
MWISKKKYQALEKRIDDIEARQTVCSFEFGSEEKTINQLRAENGLSEIAGGDEVLITKAQSDNN